MIPYKSIPQSDKTINLFNDAFSKATHLAEIDNKLFLLMGYSAFITAINIDSFYEQEGFLLYELEESDWPSVNVLPKNYETMMNHLIKNLEESERREAKRKLEPTCERLIRCISSISGSN